MASSPNSAQIELLVSRNSIRERMRSALRLHAGRGRRYSVQELAQGSGVPATNIDNAMRLVDDPAFRALKLEELASVAKFLGVPFASAFLELCGLGAFELGEQQPLDGVLDDACRSPDKLTRDDHIRKAHEHLSAAEAME